MRISALTASFTSAAVFAVLTVAVGSHLRGTVEQSFDEKYRLVLADEFIYQIDTSALTPEEKSRLDRTGSLVAMDFLPGAIVRAWPAFPPTPGAARPGAAEMRDEIAARGDSLVLAGTHIPTASNEDYFLQIGATIFRIRADALQESERRKFEAAQGRLRVQVPKRSVYFAWNAPEPEARGRAPASVSAAAAEHFRVRGRRIEISGTVMQTFDDKSIQIQSGDAFFQLDRRTLEDNPLVRKSTPGDHVRLEVPAKDVSLVWVQNDAKVPESLIRAMGRP